MTSYYSHFKLLCQEKKIDLKMCACDSDLKLVAFLRVCHLLYSHCNPNRIYFNQKRYKTFFGFIRNGSEFFWFARNEFWSDIFAKVLYSLTKNSLIKESWFKLQIQIFIRENASFTHEKFTSHFRLKGVSLSRTLKKGTFSQFSLKQKIETLVKDFSHIFRYIFELIRKKFLFENKKKSRTYRRSHAASHHGQLILRAWYCPKFSSETHIYLFFLFRRVFRL